MQPMIKIKLKEKTRRDDNVSRAKIYDFNRSDMCASTQAHAEHGQVMLGMLRSRQPWAQLLTAASVSASAEAEVVRRLKLER